MSQPATCPNCQSSFVVPDTTGIGGAGRNVCMNCGHRAAVAEFHQSPVFDNINSRYGKFHTTAMAEQFEQFFQQEPIPNPEGYRTDHRTGHLRPAKTHELHHGERPAPIRQYKDE